MGNVLCATSDARKEARALRKAARYARRAARKEQRAVRRAARREARAQVKAERAAAAGQAKSRSAARKGEHEPGEYPVHANTPLGDAALLPPQGDGAALVSAGSALARSLSEDGRDQYYDAGDAAFELDEELDFSDDSASSEEEGDPVRKPSRFGELLRSFSDLLTDSDRDYDSDDEPRIPKELRPLVGATLRHVSVPGDTRECWQEPDATSFLIRGPAYLRDKVKINSQPAVYAAVAADAFTSPMRLDHIMRRLRLPPPSSIGGPARAPPGTPSAGILPRFFVVSIQVPSYEPRLFGGLGNGPGLSIVLVHELVGHGERIAPQARGLIERFFRNESEASGEATRERLKYIPRIANLEQVASDAGLSRTEKAFMGTYDGKPVMTRPQHRFYRGPNYLEVDVDAHGYTFIARKGVHSYRHLLDAMVFDSGFVLQGGREEELPEQVLACTRVYNLDFSKARPAPGNRSTPPTSPGRTAAPDEAPATG